MFVNIRVNKFLKIGVIMTSFGFITSNAFCGGTIAGSIDTHLIKYKGDVVVCLKDVKGTVVAQQAYINMRNITITPQVTVLPLGSTIAFTSCDTVNHTIFSGNSLYENSLGSIDTGITKSSSFDKSGVFQLLCSCHPEMIGWAIVGKNPNTALINDDGKFSISNVPVGTYDIAVWNNQRKLQSRATVTVAEGKTSPIGLKIAE
jgi:plastocyanin